MPRLGAKAGTAEALRSPEVAGARRLSLVNFEGGNAGTLLSFIRKGAGATSGKGACRHFYILTCYFDEPALRRVVRAIAQQLAGKNARRGDEQAFPGYESDSDTISRDPLNIENAFDRPKPFPRAFWRTYAVDTLLGYWLPGPIANLVDVKLSDDVAPFVTAIGKRASLKRVERLAAGCR